MEAGWLDDLNDLTQYSVMQISSSFEAIFLPNISLRARLDMNRGRAAPSTFQSTSVRRTGHLGQKSGGSKFKLTYITAYSIKR